jgi:anti-sigma factor ChrR (cupin superfamily)
MEEMIYTANIDWRELREFPGTAEVKILRDVSDGGARTMLVRLPPGGQIVPHSHLGVVQHYVIEGEYATRGQSCPAGTHRRLAKQAEVDPISTQDGVTILMIYDPVKPEGI